MYQQMYTLVVDIDSEDKLHSTLYCCVRGIPSSCYLKPFHMFVPLLPVATPLILPGLIESKHCRVMIFMGL